VPRKLVGKKRFKLKMVQGAGTKFGTLPDILNTGTNNDRFLIKLQVQKYLVDGDGTSSTSIGTSSISVASVVSVPVVSIPIPVTLEVVL
jgi:hypothetical protein